MSKKAQEFVDAHGDDLVWRIEARAASHFRGQREAQPSAFQEYVVGETVHRRVNVVYGIGIALAEHLERPFTPEAVKSAILAACDCFFSEIKKEGDVIVWRRYPEVVAYDEVVKNAFGDDETISRVQMTFRCHGREACFELVPLIC